MLYGYIISTKSLFIGNMSEITIDFIWSCTFTSIFYWLLYRKAPYLFTMNHDGLYNYWQCITYFGSSLVNKETRIFYVDCDIPFSIFLELLRNSSLLIHYKFNRFRPPQLNQFDICALLFGGYARFLILDKIVLYRYWKTAFRQLIFVTVSFDIFSVI